MAMSGKATDTGFVTDLEFQVRACATPTEALREIARYMRADGEYGWIDECAALIDAIALSIAGVPFNRQADVWANARAIRGG